MPEFELTHKIIVLKGYQNTGKTEKMLRAVGRSEGLNILNLSHLRSLAHDQQQRFKREFPDTPMAHYDLPNEVGDLSTYKGNLTLVVNSIPKIRQENFENCIVLMDEIDQILSAISGENFNDRRADVILHLAQILRGAKHIIPSSRDAEPHHLELLCRWGVVDPTDVRIIKNPYVPDGRVAYWHIYRDNLLGTAVKRLRQGMRAFFALDNRAECEELAKKLIAEGIPEEEICVFTGKATEELRNSITTNINEAVKKYRVMIVSPALFTGVDLSLPHFHDIYLLAEGTTRNHTSKDFMQALMRVRNPTGQIHIWANNVTFNKPTTIEAVKETLDTANMVTPMSWHLRENRQKLVELLDATEAYLDFYVKDTALKNADINDFSNRLYAKLLDDNFTVIVQDEPTSELSEIVAELELKISNEEIDEQELIEEISHVDESVINVGEVAGIRNEFRAINGGSYEDFPHVVRSINPEDFRREAVYFDLLESTPEEIRTGVGILNFKGLGINPTGWIDAGKLLHAAKDALGGTLDRKGKPFSEQERQQLQDALSKHSYVLKKEFGQESPGERQLVNTISRLFDKCGLQVIEAGWGKDSTGKRVRLYAIDPVSYEVRSRVRQRQLDMGVTELRKAA